MNAIETSGLGKRYGRTWALHDCTLAIPAGRVVALVGPNGAGKSTLLHLAVGLTEPTAGRIAVLGERAPGSDRGAGAHRLRRAGHPALPEPECAGHPATGGQPVASAGTRRTPARGWRRWSIPLDRKVGKLSGGQHAQVALAVALARRPELLILDEPVARLDPVARHDFMAALMSAVAEDRCLGAALVARRRRARAGLRLRRACSARAGSRSSATSTI